MASQSSDFTVYVTTGDQRGAGTDADISVTLCDVTGRTSGPHTLDKWFRDDFERGHTDDFPLRNLKLDKLSEIELCFEEKGLCPDWYCEKIVIKNMRNKDISVFPVHRWLKKTQKLVISEYDCELPQESRHPDQRINELEEKRIKYTYVENYKGLPVQVKAMPEEEAFSDDIKWDITKNKLILLTEQKIAMLKQGKDVFKSLNEMMEMYDLFPSLEAPPCVEKWKDDFYFGDQRLNGCNPKLITLCRKIPQNFNICKKRMEKFLEGKSVDQALEKCKLFIIDLKILEGIWTHEGCELCAPLALFYRTNDGRVRPVAIQLRQENGYVFYPDDEENLWLLVKMWYNHADASYHQSCVHLGSTHLLMEGVSVCTNRHLSPSHPVYRLLAPHFLYLMAINTLGLERLIAPGGWVDNTMTIGREGMLQLMAKRHQDFDLVADGDFKNDLRKRGLLDDIISGYHYRNDGILIYDVIRDYVTKMVRVFYKSDSDIKNDAELQNWGRELQVQTKREDEPDGVQLKGIPGSGHLTNREELIQLLTLMIFTCSCEHAASNFNQYDEYSFPPNYPALLLGTPPNDNSPKTEADLLAALPNREKMMQTMVITRILSTRSTQPLGDFEIRYHHRPDALEIIRQFQDNLKDISQKIKNDMPNRRTQYSVLDPEIVPNSISI